MPSHRKSEQPPRRPSCAAFTRESKSLPRLKKSVTSPTQNQRACARDGVRGPGREEPAPWPWTRTAASFDSRPGTYVFEVDGAKKLYSEYAAAKGPANAGEAKVRATANHALHPTAVTVNRLAFPKRLDELAQLPPGDPRRTVFITNGGCAAGEGALTDLIKRLRGGYPNDLKATPPVEEIAAKAFEQFDTFAAEPQRTPRPVGRAGPR